MLESDAAGPLGQVRAALREGRLEDARGIAEHAASGPEEDTWEVTSMLDEIGLGLAAAGRYDEAIETFERMLELGWEGVPDGRCEIARVLLLAGRHDEADALWAGLREADPDGVWTLNAGGFAYHRVSRDEEAVEWFGEGIRLALADDDPLHVVDQMSDARRVSLRRLGRKLDALELAVEAWRARLAEREAEQRAEARREGLPVRSEPMTVAWLSEEDERRARERWPGWAAGLLVDEPFDERAARMERSLRRRRLQGDGPFTVVAIELEPYAAWCDAEGRDPADRRSRAAYAAERRAAGEGRRWPPGRNEPCWCGRPRKYKRCCGALPSEAELERAA